jgi:2-dehydro-3-deoxygalactonokinase
MRGEETQVFGAMQVDGDLGDATHVVLLPGTHSKWVEVSEGSITRFRTAITGELYALLHDHSTLLKTGGHGVEHEGIDDRDSGFRHGIERSSMPEGVLAAALFETRALQLLDQRSKAWAAGYLSGLLIGHEVASMSDAFQGAAPLCIIGEPGLVSLYRTACTRLGIELSALDGAECALAGLRLLREQLA